MLRTALGLAFAFAALASAGPAQARVTVIYPPQTYMAPFSFCPHYWEELYTSDCYHVRDTYRHAPQAAPAPVTQISVQVIRSRRASTVVIVAPGPHSPH